MQVFRFVGVVVSGGWLAENLSEAPDAGHAQDVNVVVATERLDEREVDLQCNVILVLLVRSQHA